jgi:RNase P subunit RPR2
MALFSGNLKKMQNELESSTTDWKKLASLSSGKYDLSGKNTSEGKNLVNLLMKKASDPGKEIPELSLIIRNILSRGGDFSRSRNETGVTSIHIAAEIQNGFLLKALLEAGVPAVSASHAGSTGLHKAVSLGYAGNVKLLLSFGADPGAEDAMSNSPLHLAAQMEGSSEITGMLLKAGAKAYQRNSQGKRPVDIAEEKGCSKCVSLLKESLRKIRTGSRNWVCPGCGAPLKRPSAEKVEWYLKIDMWEHLKITCGSCGTVVSALRLDGEI